MGAFNSFDLAVIGILLVAIVMGFQSGLLRALATILGYACGAAFAVAATPTAARILTEQLHVKPMAEGIVFAGVFLAAGILVAAAMRMLVGELAGKDIGVVDRMAGATLGAVRIILLAIVLVLIFDRIIPPGEPDFLAGSQLRPILSAAGAQGVQSLPPDVLDYIDRLKREHGI
jgi:membrane protein required for colicin V production